MIESVKAFMWGRSYVAECPFCKSLVDEYDREGCPHLVEKMPLGRRVFLFGD